jgi:hypothetical protein
MVEQLQISLRAEYRFETIMGVNTRISMPPLGFGSRFLPSKPKNDSRTKETLHWAYGNDYEDRGGDIWMRHYDWATRAYICEPAAHQPIVIDNIPTLGFKITTSVSRSSTANKFWRILDPRGFELEISTANMEELLMTCSVNKGEFAGYYKWDFGRNGIGRAHLVNVLPEEDDNA